MIEHLDDVGVVTFVVLGFLVLRHEHVAAHARTMRAAEVHVYLAMVPSKNILRRNDSGLFLISQTRQGPQPTLQQ